MWAWQVAGAHPYCAGVQKREDAVCCGAAFLLSAASRFLLYWTGIFPFSERFWRMCH
jgi:hypothetical protein